MTQSSDPRPTLLTLSEAAALCRVSLSTIKRRRRDGALDARRDDRGTWRTTVPDLLAAGLTPGRPDPGQGPESAPATTEVVAQVAEATERATRLEQRVRELETALGHEREMRAAMAQHLDDVRLALRAIEASPAAPITPAGMVPTQPTTPVSGPGQRVTVTQGSGRRRWWRRTA